MSADNWALCPACHTEADEDEENHTMREDYEQFMRPDGTYEVHYGCFCQRCKFKWRYEHKEKVTVPRATLTTTPANWTDGT